MFMNNCCRMCNKNNTKQIFNSHWGSGIGMSILIDKLSRSVRYEMVEIERMILSGKLYEERLSI